MGVKLFLEGQSRWETDSPHCLMMLHKMFQHASCKGRKRQSIWYAETTDMNCQSWNLRWTYLLSSWWGLRLVGRRLSPFTMRCINSGDYQGLHPESWNSWQRWCPPWKTAKGRSKGKHHRHHGSLLQQVSGPKEQDLPKDGCLQGKKPH